MKQIVLATMVALLSTSAFAGWGSIGDAFDPAKNGVSDAMSNIGNGNDTIEDGMIAIGSGIGKTGETEDVLNDINDVLITIANHI